MMSDFGNTTYLPQDRTSFMDVPSQWVKEVNKLLLVSDIFSPMRPLIYNLTTNAYKHTDGI